MLNNLYGYWSHNVINYTKNAYNFKAQNWDLDQSDNGWMYFANSGGLLEFNGLEWRTYHVPNNTLRSVKCKNQIIYVGGSSEFGYFEPDTKGGLIYTSLSSALPDWGGEVWNILLGKDVIYFQADNSIIVLKNNTLEVFWSAIKIESSSIINEELFCGTQEGVFTFSNNKFELKKGTETLHGKRVIHISAIDSDNILIVTREHGIYNYSNNKLTESVFNSLDFISQNQFFRVAINKSTLALGTIQHGVYLVDMQTSKYSNYSLANQLQNNTVLNLEFDRDDNLWLALDKGIDYISLSTPILNLFGNKTLIGSGYASQLLDNTLYLATNQGLYSCASVNNNTIKNSIEIVKNTEGQTWYLLNYDGNIFCANDNAVFIISDNQIVSRINLSGCWQIYESRTDKNTLFAILYSGIAILKKVNNKWEYSHHIETRDSFWGMISDEYSNIYWYLSPRYGISKFTFSTDLKKVIYLKHYESGRKVGENISPRKINGQTVFCLNDGIYYYNNLKDKIEPYPDLENTLEGKQYYKYLYQDRYNNIWYVVNDHLKVLKSSLDGHYEQRPIDYGMKNLLDYKFLHIELFDQQHAIINTSDGFSLLDLNDQNIKDNEIFPFIRDITSLVSTDAGLHEVLLSINDTILPYSNNTLRFKFGATDYSGKFELAYSCRLRGFQGWSIPSANEIKEYTGLPEGEYIFDVRLYVNDKLYPKEASFKFVILPPWYKSVWAYIFYFIIAIVAAYIFYKYTIKKQAKIIIEKEQKLIDQERKHIEETFIKDKEIGELHHENLKTALELKNQQLTSTTLNVIRKNEILFSIKKNVTGLLKSIDESTDSKTLKRKTLQLISLIDTNIEHDTDFEKFMNSFDQLHKNFFKILDSSFPNLSRNDKLLCAYTMMDFSSKEIAPLLNISLRGVEIARYRLRKKLKLERSDNLADFLKQLT